MICRKNAYGRRTVTQFRGLHRVWVCVAIGLFFAPAVVAQESSRPAPLTVPARLTAIDMPVTKDRDLLRIYLDHRRRLYVGAYLSSNERDPRWDAQVVALADMVAHNTAIYGFSSLERPADIEIFAPGVLEQQAQTVIDLGARGPLIHYLLTWVYDVTDDQKKMETYARLTGPEFMPPDVYPPLIRFWAARRHARVVSDDVNEEPWRAVMRAAARATVGPFVHPAERRDVYRAIWTFNYRGKIFSERQGLLDAVRDLPDADPWLAATMEGGHAIKTAWKTRGSGWASTVTDAGWKGFARHLDTARGALIRATALQPGFPEPFADLITVAMGGAVRGHESPRHWFQRATAVQVDWWPAHRNLMWALRPRWGGSHREMLALGREILAGQRFDTDIPTTFFYAIQKIDEDSEDPERRIWRNPRVQEDLDRYFREVIASLPGLGHPEQTAFVRSREAAVAFLGQRYDKARAIIDEMGQDFVPGAWYGMDLPKTKIATLEMAALGGPSGPALAHIDRLIEVGNLNVTLAALDKLEAELEPDGPFGPIYRRRFKALAGAHGGQPRPIALNTHQGRSSSAFWGDSGAWDFTEDGLISGTSTRKPGYGGNLVHTERIFDPNVEITGAVTLTPLRGRGKPNAAIVFGLYLGDDGGPQYYTVAFRRNPRNPARSRIVVSKFFHLYSENTTVEVPEDFSFRVSLREERLSVWMNGQRVIDDVEVPRYHRHMDEVPFALGLGFRASEKGQNVVFRDVVVSPGGPPVPAEEVDPLGPAREDVLTRF